MPLNWDDDEDEDVTEAEYRRRPSRVVIHEEETTPLGSPQDYLPSKASSVAVSKPIQAWPKAPTPLGIPTFSRSRAAGAFVPASERDRFAAFFIDTMLAFYVYWLIGYGLNSFFDTPNLLVLHQSRGRYAIHLLLTVGIVFFYYLLMESVLGATLGKIFCRLRVIEENGQSASLGNVFIRNFLRLVDYPLIFLIAVIAMESSPLNQRLGDRAAKTLVIKKTRRLTPSVDLAHTPLASTLSRMFAEGIDLLISLTLLYSVLLLMRPSHPLLSFVLYISTPFLFIFYYTLLEFFTGTTPGKALFKRQVVMENGEPPDGTSSLIRNIFRPLDYILGYPLLVLSKRKQRLGDMAADTLVIVKPCGQKGILGSLVGISVVLLIAYFGFTNPHSFVRERYGLGPLSGIRVFIPALRPKPITPGPAQKNPANTGPTTAPAKATSAAPLPPSTSEALKVEEFYFATGPDPAQIRHDKVFRSGDLIFAFFKIQGFAVNSNHEAQLSEDLVVEDPEGKSILSELKIVDFSKSVTETTPSILFANNIKLPKDAPQGKYRAIFTVYDKVAKTQFSFEQNFEIK
jgi:uncharacterized RDD family membrane protein YckC